MHIGGKISEERGISDYISSLLINYSLDKDHIKLNLKVLLCGSYHPVEELERLKDIKKLLIKKGWKGTFLTQDYKLEPTKNRRLLIRCQEAISEADIVIFIFTKDGGGSDGRGMELSYILTPGTYLLFKTYFIIEEETDGTSYASEVVRGEIENNEDADIRFNTSYVPVNNLEYLLDVIESQLINHLEGMPRTIPPDSSY